MRTVEFVKWFDGDNVVRVRFEIERGRILGFLVQLECLFSGDWRPILRYDTAHDFAHRDLLRPSGEAEKTRLDTQDFNEALTLAEKDITENWQKYRRRYESWL